MATTSIQDRTPEFRSILADYQRRQATSKTISQRQSLLTDSQKRAANGSASADGRRRQHSEFARQAASIGRSISSTMAKLERLAQLAKRKTLFDDRPVEINELTFVIKQDLSAINSQIASLKALSQSQHPTTTPRGGGGGGPTTDQEGEHNKNVVVLLQGKVADVAASFKDVLEVRTKHMQAARARTENFVSSVSAHTTAAPSSLDPNRTDSPLYQTPQRGRSPKPGYSPANTNNTNAAQQDLLLSLDPGSSGGPSALLTTGGGAQSSHQLQLMEEAQPANAYIQQRGEAIETIERTISELGGIFGQLAAMVSEQSEMIQRIDANTEDVVDNVQGAQRELLKYWNRVSGNRWLVAKMFGVLMIFFLLWVLIAG